MLTVTKQIADLAITEDKLASNSVSSDKIVTNAVVASKIANLNVTTDKLAGLCVTTDKLAMDAVDSTKLADNAVGTEHVQALAITSAELANSSVIESKIGTGAVTNTKLGADSVDGSKIADNSIGSEHIQTNAVGASELADNSVDTNAIVDLNVTEGKIATDAVTTNKIANAAVTPEKISDGDKIEIDFIPTFYTPDSSIPEADDDKDLAAHLKGLDQSGTEVDNKATTHLSFADPSGKDYIEVSSASYVSLAKIMFKGTDQYTPTRFKIIASRSGVVDFSEYRIYDFTHATEIAYIIKYTDTLEILSDNTLQNLPAGESIFELQMRSSGSKARIHYFEVV